MRALGVECRVGALEDEQSSLRSEMRAELTDGIVSPQGSFVASKEATRSTLGVAAVGVVIAIAIAAVTALIPIGDLPYWARFVAEAAFLSFMVFLGAYVLGGAWGWNPEQPAAAERGVTVRAFGRSTEVVRILLELDPIRVDQVSADGTPVTPVYTEGAAADRDMRTKAADTVAHMRDAAPRSGEI